MSLLDKLKPMSDVAVQTLELAQRAGADECEAGLSIDDGLSVTARMGDLESVERQQDRGLALTVYRGQRKGSASTSDFSEAGLSALVEKAVSIARFTEPDEYAGLADAGLMSADPPDLDLHHPRELDVESGTALALTAENAARGLDDRIDNSEGASVSASEGLRIYVNSHGFVGAYPSSNHSLGVSVLARHGDSLERDHWYTLARHPDDLEPAESVGTQAARRAVDRLDSRQLSTRVVPVVFVPELARGLFGHFVGAIRGTNQYRRASFLLDAVGTQVFPDWLDIVEDPHIPRALASAPFDGEGVATRRSPLVANGVLERYVLSSYSARRLGLETTANAGGAHNLLVTSNAGGFDDIVSGCERAFVVTELLGQGVNGVTGDYSRGAAGFWVENGRIEHPVSEVTVAGNVKDMLKRIVAVGDDVDMRGTVRCGTVLVDDVTVAGN